MKQQQQQQQKTKKRKKNPKHIYQASSRTNLCHLVLCEVLDGMAWDVAGDLKQTNATVTLFAVALYVLLLLKIPYNQCFLTLLYSKSTTHIRKLM